MQAARPSVALAPWGLLPSPNQPYAHTRLLPEILPKILHAFSALYACLQATRRVERVEVNYSRAAKQVDVRGLKELMWSGMHATPPPSPDTVLQFQVGAGRPTDFAVLAIHCLDQHRRPGAALHNTACTAP